MKLFKLISLVISSITLSGCVGNMNPTGGNSRPNYPYYITNKPLMVKKIIVPTGTTLQYEESVFRKGKQEQALNEKNLTAILLPEGETIDWAGVPITSITKFFNSDMRGFTLKRTSNKAGSRKPSNFLSQWKTCSEELGIAIKNTDDWSFNKRNIADVQSCSVLYQRYFKNDASQQRFLNKMYAELMAVTYK